MKRRCYNPKDVAYGRYGGRGITVCDRWRTSFARFFADVGPRPTPLHSLDRFPNNDGNYQPGNIRWATRIQQANNTRGNRRLTFDGFTLSLSDWGRLKDIEPATLSYRIRAGWTIERALTTAPYPKRK